MATRERRADVGAARARQIVGDLARDAREARLAGSLSQREVAAAAGLDRSRLSRIERGQAGTLTIEQACRLLAVLGFELAVRAHPVGEPIRDAAQLALLARFRGHLHPSLAWRSEVPIPIPGDRRAWDGVVIGPGWRAGVEAETRVRDLQAVERRIALKLRDSKLDAALLLLADTRHHRRFVRLHSANLANGFPIPGRRALELLRAGVPPGGSAAILV